MSQIVKIPLADDFYDELDDAFVGKDTPVQKFVFLQIKNLCKDSKAGKLNKSISIRTMENGQLKTDVVKLKDVDLEKYTLPSNPSWVPKELEGETVRYWEHKVTDKTWEYLELYCKMIGIRFEKYNESMDIAGEERITRAQKNYDEASIEQKAAHLKVLEDEKKAVAEGKKTRDEQMPTCMEQAIHAQIFPELNKKVMENIDVELDKEYEEAYPPEPKQKEPPKR